MAKHISPADFLAFAHILIDSAGCGRLYNRNTRLLESGVFQIGEDDKTFDRWANSVELEFDLSQPKGQRKFQRYIKDT